MINSFLLNEIIVRTIVPRKIAPRIGIGFLLGLGGNYPRTNEIYLTLEIRIWFNDNFVLLVDYMSVLVTLFFR